MQAAKLIPFHFEEKIEVRTTIIDGEPWFCASDVCSALGYTNSRKTISDNCREKGVTSSYTLTSGGKQSLTFINEGNLYRLIIKSRKPEAQRFESWVCDEVLPAIRKHGRYEDTSGKMDTLLNSTIGTDGFHMLGAVLDGKLRHLPKKRKTSASQHIWAQIHKAFGVSRGQDIPVDQLDSARNFIAAYNVHEGEWLGKEPTTNPTLDELDLAMLYVFCVDTLELIHVGEEVKPIFDVLRPVKLINVPSCLSECREVVAHLHERFGPQMEQAARNRGAFDGRRNLAAAGDPSQPIWIPRRAQGIRG